MSFDLKIKENQELLKHCKSVNAYNTGASRAYYCAFHILKNYLIINNFDYIDFLNRINKTTEHLYSHGTIGRAVYELLTKQNKKQFINNLNVLDNLYRKRRKADYEEKYLIEKEFLESLDELNMISITVI